VLSDPAPRPSRCYDPATPPHRDEQGVHVYDHATVRGLLRDPQRVTSDVSELLTPEQRDRLHPVSSFVWATDRTTREAFTVGDVAVQPGDQVLMWLTAANRDLPGGHDVPLDRFDPHRDNTAHLGWGSGYHRCCGLHHARTAAVATVSTVARRHPDLAMAGPWRRYVGVDDGYLAAAVVTLPGRPPPAPR
jgi:hypothetical protein